MEQLWRGVTIGKAFYMMQKHKQLRPYKLSMTPCRTLAFAIVFVLFCSVEASSATRRCYRPCYVALRPLRPPMCVCPTSGGLEARDDYATNRDDVDRTTPGKPWITSGGAWGRAGNDVWTRKFGASVAWIIRIGPRTELVRIFREKRNE